MAVNLNFDYKQFEGPAPPDPAQRLQRLMSLRDMEARAEDRRMGRELQAANLESLAAERDSHIAYQQEQQAKLETEREAKSAEQAARGMLANHLKKGGGRTLDDFYGAVGPTYAAKFFGEYADASEKQAKSNKEAYTAHAALGDDMAGLLVRLSSADVSPAEIHEELGRYGASLQNQFKDDPIRGPMVEELVNDDDLRAGEAGWQRYVARSGHASEEQRKINEDKRKADLDALNQQEKQAQLDKIQAETALLGRETFPTPTATATGLVQFGNQGTALPTQYQQPAKEEAHRNIDPLSPEGIAARLEFEKKRPKPPERPGGRWVSTVDDNGDPVWAFMQGAPGDTTPQAPTADARNRERATKAVEPTLNAIEELSAKINTGAGLLAKITGTAEKQIAKANYDDDVAEYESIISGFTPLVARAVGHTGVLTEQDVQSVRKLFPDPGDSKTLRDRKVKRLRQILTETAEAGKTKSGGASIDDEIMDLINKSKK